MKKRIFTSACFMAAALVLGTVVSASDSVLEPSPASLLAELQPAVAESVSSTVTESASPTAAESASPTVTEIEAETPEVDFSDEVQDQFIIGGFVYASWYDGFYRDLYKLNAANINQACLYFGRELNTAQYGMDWGYYVEAIFGTEHGQCTDPGFDGKWGVSGDGYGMSFNQCYAELGYANTSVKVGKFASPLGYESSNGIERDFNSTSYMYAFEPANHCGILGTWEVSDRFTLNAGVTTGENRSFEIKDNYGFLFGASFAITDRLTVSYEGMINRIVTDIELPFIGTINIVKSNQYEHCISASWNITSKLNYTFVTNYGSWHEKNMDMLANYFGIGNYLTYKLSDKMKAHARYEWVTGLDGNIEGQELTLAVRYDVNKYLMIRPEIRYDWLDVIGMKSSGLSGGIGAAIIF